jgi:hypothetical protein
MPGANDGATPTTCAAFHAAHATGDQGRPSEKMTTCAKKHVTISMPLADQLLKHAQHPPTQGGRVSITHADGIRWLS